MILFMLPFIQVRVQLVKVKGLYVGVRDQCAWEKGLMHWNECGNLQHVLKDCKRTRIHTYQINRVSDLLVSLLN